MNAKIKFMEQEPFGTDDFTKNTGKEGRSRLGRRFLDTH